MARKKSKEVKKAPSKAEVEEVAVAEPSTDIDTTTVAPVEVEEVEEVVVSGTDTVSEIPVDIDEPKTEAPVVQSQPEQSKEQKEEKKTMSDKSKSPISFAAARIAQGMIQPWVKVAVFSLEQSAQAQRSLFKRVDETMDTGFQLVKKGVDQVAKMSERSSEIMIQQLNKFQD